MIRFNGPPSHPQKKKRHLALKNHKKKKRKNLLSIHIHTHMYPRDRQYEFPSTITFQALHHCVVAPTTTTTTIAQYSRTSREREQDHVRSRSFALRFIRSWRAPASSRVSSSQTWRSSVFFSRSSWSVSWRFALPSSASSRVPSSWPLPRPAIITWSRLREVEDAGNTWS